MKSRCSRREIRGYVSIITTLDFYVNKLWEI